MRLNQVIAWKALKMENTLRKFSKGVVDFHAKEKLRVEVISELHGKLENEAKSSCSMDDSWKIMQSKPLKIEMP